MNIEFDSYKQKLNECKPALDALAEDHDYLTAEGVFSEELINNWIRTIKAEAAEIDKIPHPAEFRLYYDL